MDGGRKKEAHDLTIPAGAKLSAERCLTGWLAAWAGGNSPLRCGTGLYNNMILYDTSTHSNWGTPIWNHHHFLGRASAIRFGSVINNNNKI